MNHKKSTFELLSEKFGKENFDEVAYAGGMTTIIVPKSILAEVVRFLHDDPRCSVEQLTDIIGIDYQGYAQETPSRFALVYPMLSLSHNKRVILKVWVAEEDMTVPSLTDIYRGANWPEREAAEMFGFSFEGHPNPKRLLLCDLFEGKHPLRKDYPLQGQGERESFRIVDRETS
ncbi:MAG: NADH-quinone oxidoreductase subunit C [Phycisphaerae bacterium]|nr:NADH-quinone oxidoreductase subunit C [Phycisphaerae bacterium]